jgi:hypothetical protein
VHDCGLLLVSILASSSERATVSQRPSGHLADFTVLAKVCFAPLAAVPGSCERGCRLADATLQHVANVKLAANPFDVDSFAFVGKA